MSTTKKTSTRDPAATTPPAMSGSVSDLETLSRLLFKVADLVPSRMTTRMLLSFALVAHANAMGRTITLSDIMEMTEGVIGQSIAKTIQVFFEPSRAFPDALGWLAQETDEYDRRKKYLVLTDKGREITADILKALNAD